MAILYPQEDISFLLGGAISTWTWILKGTIEFSTDFPEEDYVIEGWSYIIIEDVTDNAGATYTNTGQSFKVGDIIIWNGANWTIISVSEIIKDSTPKLIQRDQLIGMELAQYLDVLNGGMQGAFVVKDASDNNVCQIAEDRSYVPNFGTGGVKFPSRAFDNGGGMAVKAVKVEAASYDVQKEDSSIQVNYTSSDININLYKIDRPGVILKISDISYALGGYYIYINPYSGDKIDNTTQVDIRVNGGSIMLESDFNNNWIIRT